MKNEDENGAYIYVIVVEERHINPEVYNTFSQLDYAIDNARNVAKKLNAIYGEPGDYKEESYCNGESKLGFPNWMFYAKFTCEGDNVRVIRSILDEEISE